MDLRSAITQVGQINRIFEECVSVVGKPVSEMNTADRMRLVMLMREIGAFRIQRSIAFVSARLKVSGNTIYNYLRQLDRLIQTTEVSESERAKSQDSVQV